MNGTLPSANSQYTSLNVSGNSAGTGILIVENALGDGRVPDPSQRDEATVAMREMVRSIGQEEHFDALLLPVGTGLLVARSVED